MSGSKLRTESKTKKEHQRFKREYSLEAVKIHKRITDRVPDFVPSGDPSPSFPHLINKKIEVAPIDPEAIFRLYASSGTLRDPKSED